MAEQHLCDFIPSVDNSCGYSGFQGAVRPARRPAGTANPIRWGYSPWLSVLAVAGIAGGLLWSWFSDPGRDQAVAWGLVLFGLCALISFLRLRTRLTADRDGIAVRSLIGSRQIDWGEITSMTAVPHSRLGAISRLLEIDLADDSLLAFGSLELGADCEQVADELTARHLEALDRR